MAALLICDINARVVAKRFLSLLCALFLLTSIRVGAGTPGEVKVGEKLRDLRMNGLTVPASKLSTYWGKPLIINVWASWCGPCRQEMPSLVRLANRHNRKQFNVIGISTDDYPEKAYVFVEHERLPFDNFIDQSLQLENMLGANRLPLTILVDRDGRVLSKHYGAQDWGSADAKRLIETSFKIKL